MRKFIIGIIISLAFIAVLAWKFDYKEFQHIWSQISYSYLMPAIAFQLLGAILFSIRWYYLLNKDLKLKHCISSSFIGYGANMVLPARGGDLLRVFYGRQEASLQFFNVLSKLFIEKVIDFIFVLLIGIFAFFFIGTTKGNLGSYTVFFVSGSIVAGVIVMLFILRFYNEWLQSILHSIALRFKKEKFFEEHIASHLVDLGEFLKIKNFIIPFFYTVIMWATYVTTYGLTAKMLGLELNIFELLFTLFCGGMSLAVPSAPSGIGVFHASVVSAFLLMGKDGNTGLVYATALHLLSFFTLTVSGLTFYLYWTYRRRHSGKPVIS